MMAATLASLGSYMAWVGAEVMPQQYSRGRLQVVGGHRMGEGSLLFPTPPPGLVVAALVRHKVAQQMPAQAGDDAGPVLCVGGELGFLERVDFVADEAGDGHGDSSGVVMLRSLGGECGGCFGG